MSWSENKKSGEFYEVKASVGAIEKDNIDFYDYMTKQFEKNSIKNISALVCFDTAEQIKSTLF